MNLFTGKNQVLHQPNSPSLMDTELFLYNPSSPHKPVLVLLTHTLNAREYQAAQALAEHILKRFPSGSAPSVMGLSPRNSTAILHGEVVDYINAQEKSTVVTLSAWAAQVLGRAYGSRTQEVPHIFTNAHSIGHLDLIESTSYGSSMATGIVVKHPSYRPLLETLNILCPTINEAFTVQQPDQSMETFARVGHGINADNLAACEEFGIQTTPLRARSEQELREKLYNRLKKGSHAIFTGNDSMALVYMDTIVETAADVGVPIITQDLASVAQGAAMGCGARPDFSIAEVANRLHQVVVDKIHPSEIPLTILQEPNEVRYNEKVFAEQGIMLTREQCSLIGMRSIYKGY